MGDTRNEKFIFGVIEDYQPGTITQRVSFVSGEAIEWLLQPSGGYKAI